MCVAELSTAARERLPLRVIVFGDGELSLIKVKQVQRGYRADASRTGPIDWPALAEAFGVIGRRAETELELRDALHGAGAVEGPALIAPKVNAKAYEETIRVLRGVP